MDHVEPVPVPAGVRGEHETTNAFFVGGEDGLLVDPAAATDTLDEAVARRDPAHVVVTHAHPDHVDGVAAYAPGRTVWACRGFEDRFEAATGVEPDRTFEEGTTIEADDGGTTIEADDGTVRVIETPGHAPDHVAFEVESSAAGGPAVLSGDLVVAAGSVVVGAEEGDMAAYLDSLRRLADLEPEVIYPGHGPTITDPLAEIERLIDHRLEREQRVHDAVREGARTPDEIVDGAYEKNLSGVRDLARSTVIAHLRKLDSDGEVDWDGGRAVPM